MEIINKFFDVELEPDVLGENLEILHSDSARLQMRMITPLLKQFNTAAEPRDEYPLGLHVWFFDKTGEPSGEASANWAQYDKTEDIWELRGEVELSNVDGRKLQTEHFFWDRRKEIIYSHVFTQMTDVDSSIVTGISFTGNQDFTNMRFESGRATIVMIEVEEEIEEEGEKYESTEDKD